MCIVVLKPENKLAYKGTYLGNTWDHEMKFLEGVGMSKEEVKGMLVFVISYIKHYTYFVYFLLCITVWLS